MMLILLHHDIIILICNGEIYNYKELEKHLNITMNSSSDCEIIVHFHQKYGIEQTLQILDGVFAFVLIDTKYKKCFICRDPYTEFLYVNVHFEIGSRISILSFNAHS